MMTDTIQRQYNEVIAPRYDRDPQAITGATLERAAEQIQKQELLAADEPLAVYDVGMGTGMFLTRLRALAGDRLRPFGLDLSQKMIDCAYRKMPDLEGAVDTAENLDLHFPGQSFDLICTHFISGFVPLHVLAPKVARRLEEGGYWSYLGATKGSYPALQAIANSRLLRLLFRTPPLDVDTMVLSPKNQEEVLAIMERNGFAVRQCETFRPQLRFRNLDEFLEFGYYGGWLTPIIEAAGLHKAGAFVRFLLNQFLFPLNDNHVIEIHLAQKVTP
jgi:SAM-dependent methyltransferase